MLRIAAAAALVGALATDGVTQAPASDVSVGVFPFLVGDMTSRIPEVVTNCQQHGVDTVYVSVFRATGSQTGTLWVTDSSGGWNAGWGSVRPGGAGVDLPQLIAACHAASIRVVGVIRCFDASAQPSDLAHRSYLLDVVDYFCDAWQPSGAPVYDLDGFALDYVRYVGSAGAVAQHVTDFVSDVRARIGALSLHAYLVANRYTFDGPVYDSVFQGYGAVRAALAAQYGQDWQALAPLLDALIPMAYTADGSIYSSYAAHRAYVAKTAEYARLACILAGVPSRRVCPAVKTYTGGGETTTASTVDASVTGALLGGGDGYQAFRYDTMVQSPAWWGPMAAHAAPGCNWPRPAAQVGSPTLTATVDPSASTDPDQASATLSCRVDFGDDGQFDTPWAPLGALASLVSAPGPQRCLLQVQDADGHTSSTRRRFSAGDPLALSHVIVSTALGATLQLSVDAGAAAAGHDYLLLGSFAGYAPGFSLGGLHVPLNLDSLSFWLIQNANGGLMSGGAGTLDGQGRALGVLQWPAQSLSFLAGLPMFWTVVAQDGAGQPSFAGSAQVVLLF